METHAWQVSLEIFDPIAIPTYPMRKLNKRYNYDIITGRIEYKISLSNLYHFVWIN